MQKNKLILVKPPNSNRGVVNAQQHKDLSVISSKIDIQKLYYSIDFLQVTLHDKKIEFILNLFGLENEIYVTLDSGMFGYNRTIVIKEKIKIMYKLHYKKGEFIQDEDMGIHIFLSGRACRELELINNDIDNFWQNLFTKLLLNNAKITRLDSAIDYFNDNLLSINKINQYIKRGQVVSKFKKYKKVQSFILSNNKPLGTTLYFGSERSDIFIYFYDKLKERNVNGYDVDKDIKFWERCELRLRGNHSQMIAQAISQNNFIHYTSGILANYIQFKIKNENQKQKSRWKDCKWWLEFTNYNKKSVFKQSIVSSIARKKDYVKIHWSNLILQLYISEHNQDNKNNFINQLLINGNITEKQLLDINNYRITQGLSYISFDELNKIIDSIRKQIK